MHWSSSCSARIWCRPCVWHDLRLDQRMQIIVPNLTGSIVEQAGPQVMEHVIGMAARTWRVPVLVKSEQGQAFVDACIAQHQRYPEVLPPRPTPSFSNGPQPLTALAVCTAKRLSRRWKITATACSRTNSTGAASTIRTYRASMRCGSGRVAKSCRTGSSRITSPSSIAWMAKRRLRALTSGRRNAVTS